MLGLIGLGVVIYTLLLEMQGRRAQRQTPAAAAPSSADVSASAASAAAASAAAASASAQSASETGAAAPAGSKSRRVSPTQAVALPRAGFWIRMAALLIDIILVGVVLNFVRGSDHLFLLALASYGAVMWKLRGSTVGGIIFNLEVVRHDGREMDWGTAVVRALQQFPVVDRGGSGLHLDRGGFRQSCLARQDRGHHRCSSALRGVGELWRPQQGAILEAVAGTKQNKAPGTSASQQALTASAARRGNPHTQQLIVKIAEAWLRRY